jgi:hypothetical protein
MLHHIISNIKILKLETKNVGTFNTLFKVYSYVSDIKINVILHQDNTENGTYNKGQTTNKLKELNYKQQHQMTIGINLSPVK